LAWRPGAEEVAASNLGRWMTERGVGAYGEFHRWSASERAEFWGEAIGRLGIVFARRPEAILDLRGGAADPRWLPGARLNVAECCFGGDPGRPAIVSGREGSAELAVTTYGQLDRLTARFADGLRRRGLPAGAGVALVMPMTVECVAAYLGTVRAGCAVVSIADSFPAGEIARRLEIGGAEVVVTVERFSRGGKVFPLYGRIREAGAPPAVVVGPPTSSPGGALRRGDLPWARFLGNAERVAPAPGDPYDTTNVLFSSGTTATPKAIPWTHLTPIKCAMDARFHQDVRAGDVVAWPTNIGWMMGPWLIYATLINGAAMALYDGAPTGDGFARFVERAGVTVLGTVPSLVRAWRAAAGDDLGPGDGADWRRVRVFSSTGEPANREDTLWLMSRAGYRAPVVEYCGGTEIGGGHLTGTVVQPASPATFTTAALGLDFVLLDEDGRPAGEGETGELFVVPPSIGLSQTLLNADHRAVYHEGCPRGPGGEVLRRHGDQVERLPGGFFRAQGRVDDAMNLGGIKVGALEIERAVDGHPAVRESAAVAVQSGGEGPERLVVFAVVAAAVSEAKAGAERARLRAELEARIAGELNPLFKLADLVVVEALPRTASNKLMRRELRRRYLEERP
jgi:acetyl-CoA synthetase